MKEKYYDDDQLKILQEKEQEERRKEKTKMDLRSSFSSDWFYY